MLVLLWADVNPFMCMILLEIYLRELAMETSLENYTYLEEDVI